MQLDIDPNISHVLPSKRETLAQYWFNVGPTLNQHYFNLLYLPGKRILELDQCWRRSQQARDIAGLVVGRRINPLSPHDALKHNFTSLKTDLILL